MGRDGHSLWSSPQGLISRTAPCPPLPQTPQFGNACLPPAVHQLGALGLSPLLAASRPFLSKSFIVQKLPRKFPLWSAESLSYPSLRHTTMGPVASGSPIRGLSFYLIQCPTTRSPPDFGLVTRDSAGAFSARGKLIPNRFLIVETCTGKGRGPIAAAHSHPCPACCNRHEHSQL